jgi:hypothetical protein
VLYKVPVSSEPGEHHLDHISEIKYLVYLRDLNTIERTLLHSPPADQYG